MITFGVVFDSKYEIPNAAVSFSIYELEELAADEMIG